MKQLFFGLLAFGAVTGVSAKTEAKIIAVEVTESGFQPSTIDVKPGTDVNLEVTRKTDQTCSTEIQVPSKSVKKTALPLNKTVTIALGKLEKGEIRFGCGMDMMDSGRINVR